MVQDLALISALLLLLDNKGGLIRSMPNYRMPISLSDDQLPCRSLPLLQRYRPTVG